MAELVGGLDQGTTSTRFVVFDGAGAEVARAQVEHRQILERPGWVEHDPEELIERSVGVIGQALSSRSLRLSDLAAIGIANQRETTIVWERATGRALAPAIVWQDTRTASRVEHLRSEGHEPELSERSGLPLSTYPSATKLEWLLDALPDARRRAERGELCFGTVDSWLTFRLSGEHVTDVTNASRTMLMDLERLAWDERLLERFGVPVSMLPAIGPSVRPPGELVARHLGAIEGTVAIGALLGDQQAAMVGQGCFAEGDSKNTYGTGNFLLVNTGPRLRRSRGGLISTVCFQLAGAPPAYALEGAIAATGSAVQWLRDQLGLITSASEVEALAASVPDAAGCYFVPAFSGLFAPWWRSDARGVIVGLTRAHGAGHLARATLEAVGFQTDDVVAQVVVDLGVPLRELRVDGGMTANALCMQLQADILGIPVVRAAYPETTVRGAALAAGLSAGLWASPEEVPIDAGGTVTRFEPTWDEAERARRRRGWARAIERSLDWIEATEG